MFKKNYTIDNAENGAFISYPSKSKHLFKDQSVYHQEDAVTADPYMDISRNSAEKIKQKTKQRSGSQSKSAAKGFSSKRSRGSSQRQSPRFQSSKKMKRELSTRSPIINQNGISTSKLMQ